MSDKIGPLLQWLNLHPNLAGLATFLISASESIAIIGTIIPGTVTMTAIGTLIGAGVIPIWPIFIWAVIGAIVGDNISYWTGHHFKDNLRRMWPFRGHEQWLESGEKFFYRYGSMSVLIGRFIGPIRAIIPIIAGMLGMKPVRFIATSILASTLWAPLYMLPGILIGEATLELPPDMAANIMLRLILTALFIIFCLWVLYKTFILIKNRINLFLNAIWSMLQRSRYFYVVTSALKHHDKSKTHGQLTLAFYLLLISVAFAYLVFYVTTHNPSNIAADNVFFYLFRSLRTPGADNVMIFITMLGDKKVLVPAIVVILGWFAWKKHWHTVFHGIALFALTGASIVLFKHLTHIQRPWGITGNSETYSFPSGHTALATAFYVGVGLLVLEARRIRHKWCFYGLLTLFIITISFSRLYLGAHWFTDVLGGWLLSAIIIMLVMLSYNRKKESLIHLKGILTVAFALILLGATFVDYRNEDQLKFNYTQLDWPSSYVSMDTWWSQEKTAKLPLYRIGRIGIPIELLNLQWVGKLNDIKNVLTQDGWVEPSKRDWADVLHRITDVSSAEHLPIVSPLYLGKTPVLILMKNIKGYKNPIVLRLWDSNVTIKGSLQELWVGSVGVVPRTYSWLINYKNNVAFVLTPEVLFGKAPNNYIIKEFTVINTIKRKHPLQQIILLKPKAIS